MKLREVKLEDVVEGKGKVEQDIRRDGGAKKNQKPLDYRDAKLPKFVIKKCYEMAYYKYRMTCPVTCPSIKLTCQLRKGSDDNGKQKQKQNFPIPAIKKN